MKKYIARYKGNDGDEPQYLIDMKRGIKTTPNINEAKIFDKEYLKAPAMGREYKDGTIEVCETGRNLTVGFNFELIEIETEIKIK